MALSDRFRNIKPVNSNDPAAQEDISRTSFFQNTKFRLHQILIERLDLEALNLLNSEDARKQVNELVKKIISEEKVAMNSAMQQELTKEVVNETFGLGPLEALLAKGSVDEILVNGPHQVYVEQHGKLTLTNISFKDDAHLRHVINRIVSAVGRRVDESSPMVDARLADGSRINAIIPPLSLNGPILSIRRFKKTPLTSEDLIKAGSMNEKICDYIRFAAENKLNILISGGTGTGKTTLLNVASRFIPNGERIITIEDAAELQLQQNHVVRLETRPPNVEGKGKITQRDLLRNALRMRPDRIVIGEVRGEEALDMLQAMNTGHEGSMTTVHANTPRDALSRIETMVLMGNSNLTHEAITRQIASAFHLIVQIRRYQDGTRKISSLSEVLGMEGNVIVMQEIAKFEEREIVDSGKVVGNFVFPPIRPKFFNKSPSKAA
jgi:pilus assembly protein CpaF